MRTTLKRTWTNYTHPYIFIIRGFRSHTMAIKHSKYRNTGIIFELLVRQTTSDLIKNQDSAAVKILKKYFTNTELGKEYSLYSAFSTSPKLNEVKANMLITTILEQYRKLDHAKISKLKYNLIREIKNTYGIDNFFRAKVDNYKQHAAVFTILESEHSTSVDAKQVVMNKITLMEHLTDKNIDNVKAPQSLINEFMQEDKEVRLIAYKILVEKFNEKYKNFSERQKGVLKEYITNVSDTKNLREYLNKQLLEIKKELEEIKNTTQDQVLKIKLQEISKFINPLKEGHTIKEEVVTGILQYCDLIDELKKHS